MNHHFSIKKNKVLQKWIHLSHQFSMKQKLESKTVPVKAKERLQHLNHDSGKTSKVFVCCYGFHLCFSIKYKIQRHVLL